MPEFGSWRCLRRLDIVAADGGEMSDFQSHFTAAAASSRLDRPLERFALELTMYCNLQCKMCNVWEIRKLGAPMALAKQLLRDARELGARTFLPFGAECFMRHDFLDIVEYAHSLEYSCQPIVTNGTMISAEHIDRLARCPSVVLNISLDGPRDFAVAQEIGNGVKVAQPLTKNISHAVGFSPHRKA